MSVEIGITASYSNPKKSVCTIKLSPLETAAKSQVVEGLVEVDIDKAMTACRTFDNIRICYLGSVSMGQEVKVFCSSMPCRVRNSNEVIATFHETLTADLTECGIAVETNGPTPEVLRQTSKGIT